MATTTRPAARPDLGFTVIELLVTVTVIGVLAAIAIPLFLGTRQDAERAAVQSDLRAAAVSPESARTASGTYPAVLTGVRCSDGVTLRLVGPATPAGGSAVCGPEPVAAGDVSVTRAWVATGSSSPSFAAFLTHCRSALPAPLACSYTATGNPNGIVRITVPKSRGTGTKTYAVQAGDEIDSDLLDALGFSSDDVDVPSRFFVAPTPTPTAPAPSSTPPPPSSPSTSASDPTSDPTTTPTDATPTAAAPTVPAPTPTATDGAATPSDTASAAPPAPESSPSTTVPAPTSSDSLPPSSSASSSQSSDWACVQASHEALPEEYTHWDTRTGEPATGPCPQSLVTV